MKQTMSYWLEANSARAIPGASWAIWW